MTDVLSSEPAALGTACLSFRVGGLACAFPLDTVREIVSMAWLWRPPGLASILEGFLNLRGTAVPIVRFDRLFSLPEQPSALYTSLIILRGADWPTGVLVDTVVKIIAPEHNSWLPVRANHSFNHCLLAEVEMNGNVIHVLSPECMLIEREQRYVAEFQAIEQHRLADLKASQP